MIFWEHIKGLNKDTNEVLTYINFQKTVGTQMINNPTIGVGATGYNEVNNHILTSGMTNGYISNPFTFKQGLWIQEGDVSNPRIAFNAYQNKWNFISFNWPLLIRAESNGNNTPYNIDILSDKGDITIESKATDQAYGHIYIKGNSLSLQVPAVSMDGHMSTHKIDITAGSGNDDGSCTAVYFNATSDWRAKKDFKLLDINALELIKKVQLYSFKYKDNNTPSIGIIAQDVENIDIEGFKLIGNENATGENFDYMTIHESKLVYILWKAIQEQQKEIEELKSLLNK